MDNITILIIIGIIILIPILIFLFYKLNLFIYQIKGKIGESIVSNELKKLNCDEYKIINNVLLKNDTRSSQIDHVVISVYGIFVIETKFYEGWIFGNEKEEYWTQSIYNNKYKFRNPIKQNWAHIYALKELLSEYKQIKYHQVIVFSGGADLKNINSTIPVIYNYEIINTILNKNEIKCLSNEQMEIIEKKIISNNFQSKKILKEHIKDIKNNLNVKSEKINNFICPKCGGKLKLRNGKYGEFYGCSNYPKCKFTYHC